jgi:hypothetical protein
MRWFISKFSGFHLCAVCLTLCTMEMACVRVCVRVNCSLTDPTNSMFKDSEFNLPMGITSGLIQTRDCIQNQYKTKLVSPVTLDIRCCTTTLCSDLTRYFSHTSTHVS